MDGQNQPPTLTDQPTDRQPVEQLTQPVTTPDQQSKPALNITDSSAQSLLMVSGLQSGQRPKKKLPTKLIIIIGALIAVVILSSYLLGSLKPGTSPGSSSSSGIGLPTQSDPSNGAETSNQINQDVKACSNAVNAVTVC